MKINKLYHLILAAFFVSGLVNSGLAQQNPHLNLYQQDYFMINPASAGIGSDVNAFINMNRQWSGIEGAPKTSTFGLHSSYKKYGFGLIVMDDQASMFGKTSANLNYSYKLRISNKKNHFLSFGLGFGFVENSLNFNDANATDYSDPILAYGNYEGWAMDARFGILYQLSNFHFGAAVSNLLGNEASFARPGMDDFTFSMDRHYLAYTGYRFSFNGHTYDENQNKIKGKDEKYFLTPSVLFHFLPNVSEQLDINVKGGLASGQWIGFTARPLTNSYLISAGINVMDLGIAYSYQIPGADITLTPYSSGTHEIMLTYNFNRSSIDTKAIKEDISKLMDRSSKLEARTDTLEQDVDILKSRDAKGVSREEMEAMEEKYMEEIEKLRKELNELALREASEGELNGGGSTGRATIGGSNGAGSEGESGSTLEKMRSDLDKLSQNVAVSSTDDVVGLELRKGANNEEIIDEVRLKDGNYVIIYSFRSLEYAKRGVKVGQEKGFEPKILYNKKRQWYYIYVAYYPELKPALMHMEDVRKGHYDDSWVHIFRQ